MRRQFHLLVPFSLTTVLTGCMTMGGTVKGNFACKAPEGVCAPSSTIDDRALAMIADASGTTGDRPIAPAGPYTAPRPLEPGFQKTALNTTRSGDRVLRIVFPAQIDAEGRLHEQTAVHAVVEQGDWRQASAENLVATSREQVAAATGGETLLAAVVRGDPPITDDAQPDANAPSPAAVAAARAKGSGTGRASADPIGEIKDQVAHPITARPQRLSYNLAAISGPATPTPAAGPPPYTPAPSSPTASASAASKAAPAQPTMTLTSASAPVARPVAPMRGGTIVPAHATAAGRAAVSAMHANAAIAAGLGRAEPEARFAVQGSDPLPVLHAAPLPGVDQ